MPQFLEDILRTEAAKKGLKGKRADRYTFGALNNMGAKRGSADTAKGKAMQRKHDAAQLKNLNVMGTDQA